MFASMMIAFREGMEAFLIVAISLAYLVRTGRTQFRTPVYYGVLTAVVLSIGLAFILRDAIEDPLVEGVLALTAGVLVCSFTIHMLRASRNIGRDIRDRIDVHAAKQGPLAMLGIFIFVTLMITREGMETVLMMAAASADASAPALIGGALLGLALAAWMGYFWVRKSHLINIGRFMQVSAIFLILFSAQMFLKGLHEISETGLIPWFSQGPFHELTEELAEDDGIGGKLVTYGLVVIPLAWLVIVTLRDRLASLRPAH